MNTQPVSTTSTRLSLTARIQHCHYLEIVVSVILADCGGSERRGCVGDASYLTIASRGYRLAKAWGTAPDLEAKFLIFERNDSFGQKFSHSSNQTWRATSLNSVCFLKSGQTRRETHWLMQRCTRNSQVVWGRNAVFVSGVWWLWSSGSSGPVLIGGPGWGRLFVGGTYNPAKKVKIPHSDKGWMELKTVFTISTILIG